MGKQQKTFLIRVDTSNEEALEQGAREIGEMLSDLDTYLARRRERRCVICLEQEWMDPGEHICWKCSRCYEVLTMLSHPLTQRSSPEHRALHEVITWMQDVPEGQERSAQEIENRLDELRASYTWSHGEQYTKRDRYQDQVSDLLLQALHDMNLFFRRLGVMREHYNQLTTDAKRGDYHLTLWDVAETEQK